MTPAQPWEVTIPEHDLAPVDKSAWSLVPNLIDETVLRAAIGTANVSPPLVSGQMYGVGNLIVPAGELVSHLTWYAGTTAQVLPLNQWCALVNALTLQLLGVTNDFLTNVWAPNALRTFDMVAPYRAPVDLPVYACLVEVLDVGGAPNSFRGNSGLSGNMNTFPNVAGFADGGLTTPASCPAVITQPTGATTALPWVGLS
jgi:hypothetical protein